ncbi:hypothetical protein DS731_09920 [Alteromonas sp. RKMC-009]|nr:hypothetical protein DS731_09920 [Alteromonas sp. RKMC-009]
MNNLLPVPEKVEVGLVLIPVVTGRIGNAVVTCVKDNGIFHVVTDFGTEVVLVREEIEQFFGVPDWHAAREYFRESLDDLFPQPIDLKVDKGKQALLDRFRTQRDLIDKQIQKIEQPEPA